MWFLYCELFALMLCSFIVGCLVTRLAVRIFLRRTEATGTDIPAPDALATSAGVVG